jgi:predicted ATPase
MMSFGGRTVELDFNEIKLCGRQEELSQLQNSLQRVTSNASLKHGPGLKGSQVVLIEGASGSGKSALVEAFREAVVDQNYIFCWGKFEENRAVAEPFSAFAECISSLFDALFRSSPTWMDEMDDEASAQVRMVAVILPYRFHHLLQTQSIEDDQ